MWLLNLNSFFGYLEAFYDSPKCKAALMSVQDDLEHNAVIFSEETSPISFGGVCIMGGLVGRFREQIIILT